MDYITERAERIFVLAHGGGKPSKEDAPLYRMYAVLSFAKGTSTTLSDVHDAWSAWIVDHHPDHRSLKPFDELSQEVQRMDTLYAAAIHLATIEPTTVGTAGNVTGPGELVVR